MCGKNKYLAPSIYSYPYWRLKSNIRFYKGVFCLFGHPHLLFSFNTYSRKQATVPVCLSGLRWLLR